MAEYAAPAPAGACAAPSPALAVPIPHIQEQIVAKETTREFVSMPVCAGDTGFDTRWRMRQYEGQLHVLHAGENPDDFRSGHWIPFPCFRPMASAHVSAATGGKSMIPHPYGVVKRRGPGALHKYWAQVRGPHSGRDEIDNFSGILAEITSDRDLLLLRVGDRALASRIQALLLQAARRAMCACVLYNSYPSLHFTYPSFGLRPLRPDTSPPSQDERVNAVREEPESQPEFYVRDVTDGIQ